VAFLAFKNINQLLRVRKAKLIANLDNGNSNNGGDSRREKQIHVSSPLRKMKSKSDNSLLRRIRNKHPPRQALQKLLRKPVLLKATASELAEKTRLA
jgi:hypothetical protein